MGECFKQFEQCGSLFGIVRGVGFGEDMEVAVAEDVLDGGGADVDAKRVAHELLSWSEE
jgi:hypothetical protein